MLRQLPSSIDHEPSAPSFDDDDESDERPSTRRRLLHWFLTLAALLAYVMAFMAIGFMLLYWTTDFGAEVRHAVSQALESWGDE